ncbi:MAG: hypothetical protein AB7O59_01370 [Pirellulales bacterium]
MKRQTFRCQRNFVQCRAGYVLVSVIVCLTVVMILTVTWVRTIVLEHRQVRAAADGVQAEYLAAAGVARAKAQLAAQPGYSGETWRIDREVLQARAGATVTIRVSDASSPAGARTLVVEAVFPADSAQQARRTQQFTVALTGERDKS